ncbi:MAG: hypothetical protein ABSF25_21310 [Bryobacteraceae bacterium]
MKTGTTVWVHPHGSPRQAVPATVDLISSNGRSVALRLRERPPWCRIADGFPMHREDFRIAMLLRREKIGPWIEMVHHGYYEIAESKPR